MKKRFLAALATGLLVVGMGGVAQALTVDINGALDGGIEDIGGYDTWKASALQKESPWFVTGNEPSEELAWANSILHTSYQLSEYYTFDTTEIDWFKVIEDTTGWAIELPYNPAYYVIKTGNNGNPDYRYFLFENNDSLGWAAFQVGLDDGEYYIKNIGGVSHVGPIGAVPEPATMLLFGTGLAGLAGIARRRKKTNA